MWWIFWPALIISAVSSRGAAHDQLRKSCNEYRVGAPVSEPCATPALALEQLRLLNEREATRRLNGGAIERLTWDEPAGTKHKFSIGIVEFDDQGNAWDPDQVRAVERDLRDTLQRSHTLVAVFVHGWKNDCKACNGNLACFRETLALLAANEQVLAKLASAKAMTPVPAREVYGVYVAWRGASSTVEPAKELSFFSRKAAADRIGSSRGGELTRLLAFLNAARETTTPKAVSPFGHMVSLLGHSFGADVLFGAVANALDASIGSAIGTDGLEAKPFGDVLVLVNPAFEASAYLRFDEYTEKYWKRGHPPLMVTVQARNDWATRFAFPAGRSIATLPQASGTGAGYRAMLTALGHQRSYYTHDLASVPDPQRSIDTLKAITGVTPTARTPQEQLGELVETMARKPAQAPRERCGCKGSRASAETLAALIDSITFALSQTPPPGSLQVGSPMAGLTTKMTPCDEPNLDAPFLMVRTDPPVVDGHSGITDLRFFDFLANLIIRTQLLRDPQLHRIIAPAVSAPPTPATWPACR